MSCIHELSSSLPLNLLFHLCPSTKTNFNFNEKLCRFHRSRKAECDYATCISFRLLFSGLIYKISFPSRRHLIRQSSSLLIFFRWRNYQSLWVMAKGNKRPEVEGENRGKNIQELYEKMFFFPLQLFPLIFTSEQSWWTQQESRDKGYPLLFSFFSLFFREKVKSISAIVQPFITTRKHFNGKRKLRHFRNENEGKENSKEIRIVEEEKNYFITRVRACWEIFGDRLGEKVEVGFSIEMKNSLR
jgi:hypothetical protein